MNSLSLSMTTALEYIRDNPSHNVDQQRSGIKNYSKTINALTNKGMVTWKDDRYILISTSSWYRANVGK